MRDSGRVITFYSYKGGVGRTMALASVGATLAGWGYRVLCIDWDLEAPGLDAYFRRLPRASAPVQGGLLDLLRATNGEWRHLIEQVTLPNGRSLGLLRAGEADAGYPDRLHEFDWKNAYAGGLGRRIEDWRRQWIDAYDFVLVDSRTGMSDSGGVCTVQLPDVLVLLFTPNEQSLGGVQRIAKSAQKLQRTLSIDRARLLVVPVPTRVDLAERALWSEWQSQIALRMGPFVAEWSGSSSEGNYQIVDKILGHLAVPYVPFWSYGEQLPVLESEASGNKLDVGFAFESLAALLARDLADGVDFALNRDDYVRRAAAGPQSDDDQARTGIFVSFSPDDHHFANDLMGFLQRAGFRVEGSQALSVPGVARDLPLGAIERAGAFVPIIGDHVDEWQRAEIEAALKASFRGDEAFPFVVPVLRADVSERRLPSLLGSLRVFLREDQKGDPAALAEAIRKAVQAHEIEREQV